jgi:2'-5' RNA ligase
VAPDRAGTRRLFLAVDLDEPSRVSVAKLIERLGELLEANVGFRGRAKWVERENLHLTIRFLGNTAEPQWADVQAALQRSLSIGPFDLRLDRIGTFPEHGAPRIVWLGALTGAAETARVFEELEQRLRATGIAPDTRPFHPHLTLGRFRGPTRRSDGDAFRGFIVETPALVHVEHVTMYESRLTPRGPRYEPLLRVRFGGSLGGSPGA